MVEIIPKPTEEVPAWQTLFFAIAVLSLLFSFSGYFLFNYWQQQNAAAIQDLDNKIAQTKTEEVRKLEEEVLGAQQKIDGFGAVFGDHKTPSKFFQLLEELSHPRVQFTGVILQLSKNNVELSGTTDGFQSLGRQLLILQASQDIAQVQLTDISINLAGGGIKFALDLTLKPTLFSSQ